MENSDLGQASCSGSGAGKPPKLSSNFGEKVIKSVMEDLKDTFAEENVSVEVLELLQKLWITKLQAAEQVELEEPPKPTELGARPKTQKILQVDGPNDSSDSDDEVNDDDKGNVQLFVNLIFSFLYARWRFKIVCLQTKLALLAIRKKTPDFHRFLTSIFHKRCSLRSQKFL